MLAIDIQGDIAMPLECNLMTHQVSVILLSQKGYQNNSDLVTPGEPPSFAFTVEELSTNNVLMHMHN